MPAGVGVKLTQDAIGDTVQHGRVWASFEPKFWKITGSLTPIRAATSETFAAR